MCRPLSIARLTNLAVAALALCAPSDSAAEYPAFSDFAGCVNQPGIGQCQETVINGGEFKLGSKTVPISKPIRLAGGVSTSVPQKLVFDGDGGLDAEEVKVPGGLTGMTGISEAILNFFTFGSNNVYATPQLVGDVVFSPGVVTLPLRIKLRNNILSSTCGIGSASEPIVLNLTTGTTTPPAGVDPLTGFEGTFDYDGARQVAIFSDVRMVDNTFTVPGASGCGKFLGINFLPFVDDLVDATIGLPAAAGASHVTQEPAVTKVALDTSLVFAP